MRVRSVEGNCYFLIKRVGTYYGNAQATHPVKQIASKSGNKFHQMSFIFLQLNRRGELNWLNITTRASTQLHCDRRH